MKQFDIDYMNKGPCSSFYDLPQEEDTFKIKFALAEQWKESKAFDFIQPFFMENRE